MSLDIKDGGVSYISTRTIISSHARFDLRLTLPVAACARFACSGGHGALMNYLRRCTRLGLVPFG